MATGPLGGPGPDFVCIGLQKAGTAWLFDQLDHHPDFWMPPIKELHYLDNQLKVKKLPNYHKRVHADLEMFNANRGAGHKRRFTERDVEFLDRAMEMVRRPVDLSHYASLFKGKGDLLSGDITPSYSALPAEMIGRLAGHFPALKVVLLVRDPIERSWSQLNMHIRRGKMDDGEAAHWEAIKSRLTLPEVQARSFPSRSWRRWSSAFEPERIAHFFFDDIIERPAEVRAGIVSFVGGNPDKPSGPLPPGYNRKSVRSKVRMTDEIKARMVELFREELVACAATFGGRANGWLAKYGLA